ncbi:MAG: GNAT family N-acetyltransferase [Bacteroidota bacterium]
MHYQLRKAQREDIPQIAALLVKSWREHYHYFLPSSFLKHMSVEKQIARHERYYTEQIEYLIVEGENEDLLAFASHGPMRGEEMTCDWELYTLYVASHAQGKGIGSALLGELSRQAKQHASNLGVWVMEQNPFKSFYEKHAFKAVSQMHMEIGNSSIMNIGYLKELST